MPPREASIEDQITLGEEVHLQVKARGRPLPQLGEQPALADPGRPRDDGHPGVSGQGVAEAGRQLGDLGLTVDHGVLVLGGAARALLRHLHGRCRGVDLPDRCDARQVERRRLREDLGLERAQRRPRVHPELLREQGESILYAAPVQGAGEVCSMPVFSQGAPWSHFLPLNCQLIDPIKLTQPVDTTIGWLLGLDLAQIDTVFALPIPGVGFALSLLAVIAAVLQFVQVKMTSPRPNPEDPTSSMTSTMIYTFPLLTIIWGGIFPSGLILYWIIYTAYLVVQQYLIMGWGNLFPLFGWQPRWAPSPEAGIARAERPKRLETDDAPPEVPAPASNRATGPGGGRAGTRPANRKPGGAKRRGRKR